MANQHYDDDEIAVLIATGILVVGAAVGTYVVLKAIGSYKRGQVITGNEAAKTKPEPRINSNYKYGNCEAPNCKNRINVELCNRYFGNTSLPNNHCFPCGDGLHYESLRMCLECAKWDSADDDD